MTSPQAKAQIRKFFIERLDELRNIEKIYEDNLFNGHKTRNSEVFDKAASEHPITALAWLIYEQFVDTFEILQNLSDSILESEDKIAKVEHDMHQIAKETNVDISTMKTDIDDLKLTMLPAAKSMVQLFDNLKADAERRKKSGERIIV